MSDEHYDKVDLRRIAELAMRPEQIVPVGDHLFRCVAAEWATSRAGNPMIKGRWEVAAGQMAAGFSAWGTQVVTDTPRRARALMAFFEAHGVDPLAAASPQDVAAQLVGRSVWAAVEHEMYNGEPQARLVRFWADAAAQQPPQQPPQQQPAAAQPPPPQPTQVAEPWPEWPPPQQQQPAAAQPLPPPPLPPQQQQPAAAQPPQQQPTAAALEEAARARVASMLKSEQA